MSPPPLLPRATEPRGFRHPGCSRLVVIVTNAVLGVPTYFVIFLFAYAFDDEVTWANHVAFLLPVAAFAVVTGFLAMTPAAIRFGESSFAILTYGALASLSTNAAAVGLGSIVSAANKDQGSVSADFSHATDVLVALGLLTAAVAFGYLAAAVRRSAP